MVLTGDRFHTLPLLEETGKNTTQGQNLVKIFVQEKLLCALCYIVPDSLVYLYKYNGKPLVHAVVTSDSSVALYEEESLVVLWQHTSRK
eukprot:scaffold104771_cov76-Attheya_sp.AAC.1